MSEHINQAAPERAITRLLPIEFTGSGSEYFRIWIVNLLLIIVTLGFYLPFAKARRLNYFYSNTLIDGHALGFHGSPWKMLRGFVLLVVLMAAYAVAGRFSPISGLIAFGVLCVVWPALWRASLQFRLSNTSWRGLRFGFRAPLTGAYVAVLPVYLPVLLMLLAQLVFKIGEPDARDALTATQAGLIYAPIAVLYLLLPWSLALIRRYQHGGYVYADQQARLDVSTRRFYTLCLKGLGVSLLAALVMGAIAAIGFVVLSANKPSPLLIGGAALLSYLLYFALVAPYFTARMQNLVWLGTHSTAIRFDSQLHFRPLAWLTLKNWLLTLLTLGLYRPFAVVNTAQMRLDVVGVFVDGDLDSWTAQYQAGQQDASGEAAGDFFGIDMGL